MTRVRIRAAGGKRAGVWRLAVQSWLCALAIAVQCIVVQGHVHSAAQAEALAIADAGAASSSDSKSKDQIPGDRGQSSCFICQQMALAGSAVLPVTPVVSVVQRELVAQPAAIDIVVVDASVSHSWRSRAPPISL
jgi:hypothetical protein